MHGKVILPAIFLTLWTYSSAQSHYSMRNAVEDARRSGFMHLRLYEKLNEEAADMRGNRALDSMEIEFIRGEFNGPYPSDFQGLAKQNLGNGFDQIYLTQWNKARRKDLEFQLALESARIDVAVRQAYLDWVSAAFLLKQLNRLFEKVDSVDFDTTWKWTKRHMEMSSWQSRCEEKLKRFTGKVNLSSELAPTETPKPMIRSSVESQVSEDFSLLSLRNNAQSSVTKWERRYNFSQKLPDIWFGYYQLTIADTYGYDGILIQMDVPWSNWFEQKVEPIAELPAGVPSQETFDRDQLKVNLIEEFSRFEGHYLTVAPELLKRAQNSNDLDNAWPTG